MVAGAFVLVGVGVVAVLITNAIRTALRGCDFEYPYQKGWPPGVKPVPPPPPPKHPSVQDDALLIHYAVMFRQDLPLPDAQLKDYSTAQEALRAPESYPAISFSDSDDRQLGLFDGGRSGGAGASDTWDSGPGPYSDSGNPGNTSD